MLKILKILPSFWNRKTDKKKILIPNHIRSVEVLKVCLPMLTILMSQKSEIWIELILLENVKKNNATIGVSFCMHWTKFKALCLIVK